MHRTRMHPNLLLFSRGLLIKVLETRYSVARPPPVMEARGFAFTRLTMGLPFSQGFSKEDAPTTSFIIRFSGISRQHISESQCLGAELPLLTELPTALCTEIGSSR